MSSFSKFLLFTPILTLAATAQAKPAKKSAPKTQSVRVLDIATYQIAPAPGAPKLKVHLWGTPRKPPASLGEVGARWKTNESPFEMAPSPFVYDVFAPNGKGGWDYLTTFIHRAVRVPTAPTVRYLNNKTKDGFVFQVEYSDLMNGLVSTLYTLPDVSHADSYSVETLRPTLPTGGWRTVVGFSRDARGYVQLVSAYKGYGVKTGGDVEYRTVSSWDEEKQDWKAGPEIRIEAKADS